MQYLTAALWSRRNNAAPDREDEKFDVGSQENKKSLLTYIFKRNSQKARYSGSDASRICRNYQTDVKETNFLCRTLLSTTPYGFISTLLTTTVCDTSCFYNVRGFTFCDLYGATIKKNVFLEFEKFSPICNGGNNHITCSFAFHINIYSHTSCDKRISNQKHTDRHKIAGSILPKQIILSLLKSNFS
jgi:hypothetical protein